MFWILSYLAIGIFVSAKCSRKGIAQILRYNNGEAIAINGSSPADAKERARKFCVTLNRYKDADADKFAGFLVSGFVGVLLAWPGFVYVRVMYNDKAYIQNGVVLD